MCPLVDDFLSTDQIPYFWPSKRDDPKHAWIPISNGCNSFCTYCVVPIARGREKSRPEKEILTEIKNLVKKGYERFTLLGQNVNSYGLEKVGIGLRKHLDKGQKIPAPQSQYKSFQGDPPFVKLLDKICNIKGIEKISFMSSNPWDFSDELIEVMAKNKNINRTIHLPVQSGDDEILKKMNRNHTREDYLNLIKKIKNKISEVEFTTDTIVGFPGETEEQFNNTVNLYKEVGFNIAFISSYSPRPGTVAEKMEDNVKLSEKKRRFHILDDLINKK